MVISVTASVFLTCGASITSPVISDNANQDPLVSTVDVLRIR